MPAQVQPILFTKFKGTSNPVLGFLDGSGCAPTLMGSTFGAPEVGNTDTRACSLSRKFKGDAYTINGNQIWKSAGGSGTPTSVYTFAVGIQNAGAHLGLYVRLIGGVATLCTAYNTTNGGGTTWNIAKSTNGSSWSEVAVTSVGAAAGPVGKQGIWRNQVHFVTGVSTVSYIDFESGIGGSSAVTAGGGNWGTYIDFCAYKGIFYALATTANGALWALWALSGATWVLQSTLPAPAAYNQQTPDTSDDTLLFADGSGNLVAIAGWAGNFRTGYSATKIVANSLGVITSQTDITSTILPTSWIVDNIGDNSFGAIRCRFWCYQEMDSIPGTVTTHLYFVLNYNEGHSISYYLFNGVAAKIGNAGIANDSGGDATYALPHCKMQSFACGSLNIWDTTSPEVYFSGNPVAGINALNAQFGVFNTGNTLTPTKNITGYFVDKVGEMENNSPMHFSACRKVSGAGATPTLSNDHLTIQGCSGDGTVYEGTWDVVTDSIMPLDRVAIVLDAR